MWKKEIKFFENEQVIVRFLIGGMLVLGILFNSVLFLFISAIVSGINYGLNNDTIWEPKSFWIHKDMIEIDENEKHKEILYKHHQLWVHLVCSIVGFVAFCILLNRIGFWHFTQPRLELADLILLILALLGYTGLLPRALWFFTHKPEIKV